MCFIVTRQDTKRTLHPYIHHTRHLLSRNLPNWLGTKALRGVGLAAKLQGTGPAFSLGKGTASLPGRAQVAG